MKGLYKFRMVYGSWFVHLCDFDHTIRERLGPFKWSDLKLEGERAETLGYKKEQ